MTIGRPHDLPTAAELTAAVRDWLADDVAGSAGPPNTFHLRVAVNVLGIVARELEHADAHEAAHRDRLTRLGVADDAELCRAIRSGHLDDRLEEVRGLVWDSVRDKLVVANPGYLERRHPGD